MKKRLQGLITGMLIGTTITGGIVFASTGTKTIDAIYNNIKIYVDGVKITPKDANGNTVEPFIYNGTTYLPVRAIGNALGKDVSWDNATQSVYLGQNPNKVTYLMEACPPYQTESYEEYLLQNGKSFEMSGKKYSNGFILGNNHSGVEAYALFNLNCKYSDITFTIGHIDNTYMDDQEVLFFVDGSLVKTIEIGASDLAKEVSIPVKNGSQLKILRNVSFAELGFGNITVK